METNTLLILTTALIVALALIVIAGIGLTARSYILLLDVLRLVGSWVVQLAAGQLPAPTTSLTEMERDTKSAPKEDTPTTPDNPKL